MILQRIIKSFGLAGMLSVLLLASACDKGSNKTQSKEIQKLTHQVQNNTSGKQKSPNWSMIDLNGESHNLSDYKGKVVILDFWDTWCPPCKQEIPGFIELQDKYKNKDLVVLGAAFGRDGKETVSQFADSWKINYPVLLANREVIDSFGGIRSIPTTFIINKEGYIVSTHIGYVPKEKFEEEILKLL